MKKILLAYIFGLCFCSAAVADTVIVNDTMGWTSVPITVDTTAGTYTITGTVPTGNVNYYYEYPGYRCVTQERTDISGGVVYKSGSNSIWCYAVP